MPTPDSIRGRDDPARVAAVVPVKRFGGAKSRLTVALAAEARRALAAAMVADSLEALRRARLVDAIVVVTGEAEVAELARLGGAIVIDDPDDTSHSHAALLGAAEAGRHGAEVVAMLPGDCPLLDPRELDAAIEALAPPELVVIPDRHGEGTNGLILSPPDLIAPACGPGSCARHHARAAAAGADSRTLKLRSLALDADTAEDLELIRERLGQETRTAPRTREQLERIPIEAR